MNLVQMLKNGISIAYLLVKCEASYKSKLFNACRLQIGRVGTYRQVLHLTITVCRKLQDKVYIRTNITRKMVPITGRARSFLVFWSFQEEG